jgi:hypothetical protein
MRLLLTIALTAITLGGTLAQSYAASCNQLWVERNSYYKNAGYCFATQRAISYFGNGGCTISDQSRVHLSAATQNLIAAIQQMEKRQGCAD